MKFASVITTLFIVVSLVSAVQSSEVPKKLAENGHQRHDFHARILTVIREDDELSTLPIEDRLPSVVRSYPITFIQSGFSLFFVCNFLLDRTNLIPLQYKSRVRLQCIISSLVIGFIEVIRWTKEKISSADLEKADSVEEVVKRTISLSQEIVHSSISKRNAYTLITFFLNYPSESLIGLFISEIPNLLRAIVIFLVLSDIETDFLLDSTLIRQLFHEKPRSSEKSKEGEIDVVPNELTIDEVFDRVSLVFEMTFLTRFLVKLLKPSQNIQLYGTKDLIILGSKIYFVLNYGFLRTKAIFLKNELKEFYDTIISQYNNVLKIMKENNENKTKSNKTKKSTLGTENVKKPKKKKKNTKA